MYVLPKCHKKSAMIKSNPSCSVRNACRVHFRHRPINSFTFSKSNIFKTLNWSWKFFLFLSVFVFASSREIFSHQVMLHLLDWNSILCSATICLPASVPFAYCIYHLQCNVVFLSVFQLHSIKQAWMYIMPWSMKLYLGHTWFHWPTFQYVFPKGFKTNVKCPSSHHYKVKVGSRGGGSYVACILHM
jgi:hypothetical protein